MNLKNECSLKDTAELRKMILENPELPLLIFCGEDAWQGIYPYNLAYPRCEIENLTLYNDIWMEEDQYEEELSDDLCDEEEYKDLSDEEWDKMIKQKVEETEFVKAIVVWIG